jgi:hypothetical protein
VAAWKFRPILFFKCFKETGNDPPQTYTLLGFVEKSFGLNLVPEKTMCPLCTGQQLTLEIKKIKIFKNS